MAGFHASPLVSQSHSFHLLLDSESADVLVASRGACHLLGYSAEEIESMNLLDIAEGISFASFFSVLKCLYFKRRMAVQMYVVCRKRFARRGKSFEREKSTDGEEPDRPDGGGLDRFAESPDQGESPVEVVQEDAMRKGNFCSRGCAEKEKKIHMLLDFQLFNFGGQYELVVTGHSVPPNFLAQCCKLHSHMDPFCEQTPTLVCLIDSNECCFFVDRSMVESGGISVENLCIKDDLEMDGFFTPEEEMNGSFESKNVFKGSFSEQNLVPSKRKAARRSFSTAATIDSENSTKTSSLEMEDMKVSNQGEAIYSSLFDIAMFGTCSLGNFGLPSQEKITSCSRGLERMLGYSRDRLIGMNFASLLHPDDVAPFQALYNDFVNNRKHSYEHQCRFITMDGSILWIRIIVARSVVDEVAFEYENERDVFSVCMLENITEEMKTRSKLLFEQKKFQALFELCSNPLLVFINRRLVDCNEACVRMLGYQSKQQVLSFKDPDQFSPLYQPNGRTSRDMASYHFNRVMVEGQDSFEWHHLKSDGTIFPVNVKIRQFVLEGLEYQAVVWHDLTEYKRNQEELRKAKEAAESASLAKSQFLANMSHEIRTPMNGVIGMIEILESTNLTEEQKSYVNIIRTSGDILLRIISDVLDLSKIESNNLHLEYIPFEFCSFVRETVSLLDVKAKEKGLRIILNVDSSIPPYIVGDSMRIRQVLFNLVSNAIKFTDKGTISIRIKQWQEISMKEEQKKEEENEKAEEMEQNNSEHCNQLGIQPSSTNYLGKNCKCRKESHQVNNEFMLLFEVKDTGIGIDDSAQERLFKPFVQADESTSRRYGGTGLGLIISKTLVNLMGGKIWMDSAPGKGSIFSFTLRTRSQMPSDLDQTRSSDLEESPSMQHHLKNLKVLVVEDNRVNRMVVTRLLLGLGITCEVAEDGLLALEMFQKSEYDIIFMDCHMPGMDGFDATMEIRKLENRFKRSKRCLVIALTASALSHERQRCLNVGMDEFLTKPVKSVEIKRVILNYISRN